MNDNFRKCYTFDDVQIKDKYSEIVHRADCDVKTRLTRNFNIDIPIVSAPMDTVTEHRMAFALAKLGGVGVIHRFNNRASDEVRKMVSKVGEANCSCDVFAGKAIPIAVAIGATGSYLKDAEELLEAGANVLLIDVAKGNSLVTKNAIENLKKIGGKFDLIAGNVATREGARNLCEWGVSAIRVGIGNGCFAANTAIKTASGLKKIQDIRVGDFVLTHRSRYKKVTATSQRIENERIYSVNGNECTSNHEFYVLNRKYANIVNDDNIEQYAEWIPAGKLSSDFLLLKIKEG